LKFSAANRTLKVPERRVLELVDDQFGVAHEAVGELVDLRAELVVIVVSDTVAKRLRSQFGHEDELAEELRRIRRTGRPDELLGVIAEVHRILHPVALVAERTVLLREHLVGRW